MYSIYLRQVVFLLLAAQGAFGQVNIYEHDLKYARRYFHFGIAMGVNFCNYKITLDSQFVAQGEVVAAFPITSPGFTMGIVSSLHLSPSFEMKFIPALSFADRSIRYHLASADTTPIKRIESVYLEFPLHLKYRSKPYKDFRLYVLSGLKYNIDMQSNATARLAENLIKVFKHDIAFEYGLGAELHLPLVIVAPEIKVSYGLLNILKPDDQLIYARIIERLRARSVMISIQFEG